MKIKPGVQLNGLHYLLWYAAAVYDFLRAQNELGEGTISSALDSAPGRVAGSLHRSGLAVDLRSTDIPAQLREPFANELQRMLGHQFEVILESDHFHVELSPSLLSA